MKHLEPVLRGFLLSLGFLPFAFFSVWLFHVWPAPTEPGLDAKNLIFDSKQLAVTEARLTLSDAGVSALGQITNNADKSCGFIQLECDLTHEGELIGHESVIISNLAGKSSRGYSVLFEGDPEGIDPAKLKMQVTIAQSINLVAEEAAP